MAARLAELGAPIDMDAVRARRASARSGVRTSPMRSSHAGHAMIAPTRSRGSSATTDRHTSPMSCSTPPAALRLVTEPAGSPPWHTRPRCGSGCAASRSYVAQLRHLGLWGIEVYRAEHTPEQRDGFARIARRLGLVATGGSDFHGPRRRAQRPRRHRVLRRSAGASPTSSTGRCGERVASTPMTTARPPLPVPTPKACAGTCTPLIASADDARALLDAGIARARTFESRYRGSLATITPAELADGARSSSPKSTNMLSRAGSYAHLREATDVTDPENRDLVSRHRPRNGRRRQRPAVLRPRMARPARRSSATALAGAPELAADAHYLRAARRLAPFMLTEPEERMLAEREPAAVSAWQSAVRPHHLDAGDGVRCR